MTLLGGEYGDAGRDLLRERLLVVGTSLSHVTCPECGVELARVVRDLAHENILLSCDECGEVTSPRSLQETYKVSLPKLIDRLMLGLGTQPSAKKEVATEVAWRIGVTEPVRGKPLTWYFARHLHDHKAAQRLVETIRQDQAHKSAKVLTSSALPLPEGSPLSDFDVVHLSDIARISQSKFEFFNDRMTVPVAAPVEDTQFRTTLRLVRTEGHAAEIGFSAGRVEQAALVAACVAAGHALVGITSITENLQQSYLKSLAAERAANNPATRMQP